MVRIKREGMAGDQNIANYLLFIYCYSLDRTLKIHGAANTKLMQKKYTAASNRANHLGKEQYTVVVGYGPASLTGLGNLSMRPGSSACKLVHVWTSSPELRRRKAGKCVNKTSARMCGDISFAPRAPTP